MDITEGMFPIAYMGREVDAIIESASLLELEDLKTPEDLKRIVMEIGVPESVAEILVPNNEIREFDFESIDSLVEIATGLISIDEALNKHVKDEPPSGIGNQLQG